MVDMNSKVVMIESFSGKFGFSFNELVACATHLVNTVHIPHRSLLDRRSTDSLTAEIFCILIDVTLEPSQYHGIKV